MSAADLEAQVAQSVEQRTENPRVGGSIPPLGTTNLITFQIDNKRFQAFIHYEDKYQT